MTDRRVWFVSDTHFGHDRIRDYCRPQFSSLAEMEDCLITNWNETVGKNDLVYHLGDFARTTADAVRVRPKLNGAVRLVVGNHDDIRSLVEVKLFQRVSMWRMFDEYNFVATHVPMHTSQFHDFPFNVHGHVHGNLEGLTEGHIDVSVESVNYRPVSAEFLTLKCTSVAVRGLPNDI